MRMRQIAIALLTLFTTLEARAYTIVSTQTTQVAPNLMRTDWVIAPSANPVEQFSMHRVTKINHTPDSSILMLYPLCCDFRSYEFSDDTYSNSFAGYLATRNVEVWGYSGRGHLLPDGYCDTHDCSIASTWSLAAFAADVEFIRDYIDDHSALCKKPAIGGLSLGAILAIAVVNTNPTGYSGLFLWDGSLYTTDAASRAYNVDQCAAVGAQVSAGVVMVPNAPVKGLAAAALVDPGAHLAWWGLMTNPPPVYPLRALPDFFFVKAGVLPETYQYAIEARLNGFFLFAMNAYFPNRAMLDVPCSLAGDTTYVSNLGSYHRPILALGAGHGFGQTYGDLLSLFGTPSWKKTVFTDADFGHFDHYTAANHLDLVEKKVVSWLKQVF